MLNIFSNKRNINQTSIDIMLKKSFCKLNKCWWRLYVLMSFIKSDSNQLIEKKNLKNIIALTLNVDEKLSNKNDKQNDIFSKNDNSKILTSNDIANKFNIYIWMTKHWSQRIKISNRFVIKNFVFEKMIFHIFETKNVYVVKTNKFSNHTKNLNDNNNNNDDEKINKIDFKKITIVK